LNEINRFIFFIQKGENDERLTPTHISFFTALFYCWLLDECKPQFHISRRMVMKLAKIQSTATYHKCVRDLLKFGYIDYFPTFNPSKGSSVKLNFKK
jgi:hypothetical protein